MAMQHTDSGDRQSKRLDCGHSGVRSGVTYAGVFSIIGGVDGQLSLAAISATMPPSRTSQARPFSRLVDQQITANSSQLNINENGVTTVVQRRTAATCPIFQFADPIIPAFVSGAHRGGHYHQSLECDQLPMGIGGQEWPKETVSLIPAFRMDPLSVKTVGVQTSPNLFRSLSGPATQDAATSPSPSFLEHAQQ